MPAVELINMRELYFGKQKQILNLCGYTYSERDHTRKIKRIYHMPFPANAHHAYIAQHYNNYPSVSR